MKKLLLIGNNTIHTAGFLEMAGSLVDEVMVLTNRETGHIRWEKMQTVDLSVRKIHSIPSSIRKIRSVIKAFDPDVIHVQQAGTEAWLAVKANNGMKPLVVSALGSDILLTPGKGRLFRKMTKEILKKAEVIICDSAYVAYVIHSLAGDGCCPRVEIIHPGTELPKDLPEKEKMIYSNRMHHDLYRIDQIIRAFADFCKAREKESWKLVIAGSGPQTVTLKGLTDKLKMDGKVEFTGWVDRQKNMDFYRRAMIYVSNPVSDATSVGLLEAMAAGCVPVLSNLPANHEWVIDGYNGVICEHICGTSFRKALSLDGRKISRINREILAGKADKHKNREKYLAIYRAL
ncbi:MAG: glycosyltransferase [Bacteroidales bacterium]